MKCTRCSIDLPPNVGIFTEEKVFCPQCNTIFNTCAMCKNASVCEFVNNPDPMPKMVLETVRQGNMEIQQTVVNQERVNKFCVRCVCYHSNFGCCKEYNGCLNYDEKVF